MNAYKYNQWGSIDPRLLTNQLSAAHRFFVVVSLVGVLLWSIAPHAAAAQVDAGFQPFVFEFNNFSGIEDFPLPEFSRDYFSDAYVRDSTIPLVPDPRIEILRDYLISKNSPLADHAEFLLQQSHYRLVIGISFAESNFCKRNIRPNNCWGIGGTNPETYADYNEALTRANGLIQKYQDGGLTSPKLMRNRWVGWKNHNWILAVEQVIAALEQRGL